MLVKKISKEKENELLTEVKRVRENAYAPYSHFKVGAAVLCGKDKVFTGYNVENVSLGLSICAERAAIVKAFSERSRKITHIAIITDTEKPSPPCGICRQIMYEFNPDMVIILANLKGKRTRKRAKDLLPLAYRRNIKD